MADVISQEAVAKLFGSGATTTTSAQPIQVNEALVQAALGTGSMLTQQVSLTGAERGRLIRWREHQIGKTFPAADPYVVPRTLYDQFKAAQTRIQRLYAYKGSQKVNVTLAQQIVEWWRRYDPAGLGAWDRTVTSSIPITWYLKEYSTGPREVVTDLPPTIVSQVTIYIQQKGWPDALEYQPPEAAVVQATGKNLGPAPAQIASGFLPVESAVSNQQQTQIYTTNPLFGGGSTPEAGTQSPPGSPSYDPLFDPYLEIEYPGQYAAQEGGQPGGGIRGLLTPTNLLLGGAIVVGLYLILRRK